MPLPDALRISRDPFSGEPASGPWRRAWKRVWPFSRDADSAGVQRWSERTLTAGAMALVLWFYGWTIAVNGGFQDWGDVDYYRLQVRGWMKGQLNLDQDPKPELLALADPYDPLQNAGHKLGDATLYRGRYYIYFGAAPAFTVMLPYRLLTGREMTTGAATLVFCSIAFLAASGLWLAVRRRYFPESMIVMAPAGVLAIGFGTHLLALAQRPMFWELAIVSGIAFSTLAVCAAYLALRGRWPVAAMGAAGLFVGLAVGSRPTCLLAAPLLLPPIWMARRREALVARTGVLAAPGVSTGSPFTARKLAIAAAVPLIGCGAALMAHNYARFGNPLEFGQHYQLSGAYEGKLTHFSLRFIPHNFAVYFFQRLRWEPEFPFVSAPSIQIDDLPGYFGTEEVSGLAVTFPFYWFLLALPFAWWRRRPDETRHLAAACAVLSGYAVPVMGIVLCYFSTTMRYEADFAVPVAVLALMGMLALERRLGLVAAPYQATPARRAARVWIVAAAGAAACGATVVTGALVSFDYHERPLIVHAHHTWVELSSMKERVLSRAACWLGQIEGPRVLKVRFRPQPGGTVETLWESADQHVRERIVLQHRGPALIRFGYQRGSAAIVWGRELRWKPDHIHTVSVQLPSLYPPAGDGWWDRTRRHHEFRERTSIAVWFSGGRALEAVVEPLPAGFTPGGAVGRDFSGEVRRIGERPYRSDEIAWGADEYHAPRGGVLQMRVMFPPALRPEGEPLFAAGERRLASFLFAQPAADGVKLVFQTSSDQKAEVALVRPDPRGNVLELEMPTFSPDAFGWEKPGDVVVRLDGREVLRTNLPAAGFMATTEQIGRNLFGMVCGPRFRGWILDVKWRPEARR